MEKMKKFRKEVCEKCLKEKEKDNPFMTKILKAKLLMTERNDYFSPCSDCQYKLEHILLTQ